MDYREFAVYLREEKKLLDVDVYFAEFAERLAGAEANSALYLLAALVSGAANVNGEVCLPETWIATAEKLREYLKLDEETALPFSGEWLPEKLPERWEKVLVKQNGRFYLAGDLRFEEKIRTFVNAHSTEVVPGDFDESISSLKLTAGQQDAVRCAAAPDNKFLVVSGGPGTGKTTILATILAVRNEDAQRICLCAPTGKAQARMQEALQEEIAKLNISKERKEELKSIKCGTIHRILQYSPVVRYRCNAGNQLECDLLVVDECSMVSLRQLGRIIEALPEGASLILLGDYAQLASVQPGRAFADVCEMLKEKTGHLAVLTESKRFPADKGVAKLRDQLSPELVEPGEKAWECLAARPEQLDLLPLPAPEKLPGFLKANLGGWMKDGKPFFEVETIEEAWEGFESMRILTPSVLGKYGSDAVSIHICNILGLEENSPGLPLLQRKNDYALDVYNGDTGLLWFAGEDRQPLRRSEAGKDCRCLVFFPKGDGEWYGIEPELLKEAETAFAMTVHKAQGSGYGKVLFILPELSAGEGLLTRELIYTAVTRGKPEAVVVTEKDIFTAAANRRVDRASGLSK